MRLGDFIFQHTKDVNKHNICRWSSMIFIRHIKFQSGNSRGFSMLTIENHRMSFKGGTLLHILIFVPEWIKMEANSSLGFCDGVFWDTNLTWYTDKPQVNDIYGIKYILEFLLFAKYNQKKLLQHFSVKIQVALIIFWFRRKLSDFHVQLINGSFYI